MRIYNIMENTILGKRGTIVLKTILTVITVPLFIIHLFILYFWVFNWKQLITDVGLFSWIGSIILGILIYFIYRIFVNADKFTILSKRLIFSSTLLSIILGIFAIAIEFITNSMP
ncbi:hypothetical protein VBD025_16355 [Virgibacillus flavescens]|uniref:hypothetical protein n=1 Tax=Virgibacillus flavescens TaxID=1611422 RepID=UPI003D33538A